MITTILDRLTQRATTCMGALARQVHQRTRPLTRTLGGGARADVPKTKRALISEHPLLAQQLPGVVSVPHACCPLWRPGAPHGCELPDWRQALTVPLWA